MSALGDILNDKDLSFQYKRMYFSLKTRINSGMWDHETGFYHDMDDEGNRLPQKTIAGFWPLLAEIPNEDKAEKLIAHLQNPKTFGVDHPFPSLSADDPEYDERGIGLSRKRVPSVHLHMVVKGLEKYQRWDLARECAIRHLYYVLDALSPNGEHNKGSLWEAYMPGKEGAAQWPGKEGFPRKQYLPYSGLSTIALMIENIIGLSISLPRKTVDWIIPNPRGYGHRKPEPQAEPHHDSVEQESARMGNPHGKRKTLLLHDKHSRPEEEDAPDSVRKVLDADRQTLTGYSRKINGEGAILSA